jgi:hypothetical protein
MKIINDKSHYKVWDNQKKIMHTTGEQGLLSKNSLFKNLLLLGDDLGQWSLWEFDCNNENYSKCLLDVPRKQLCHYKNGIILQNYGYKDKNKNIISVGDIVDCEAFKDIVVIKNGVMTTERNKSCQPLYIHGLDNLEVIGNIYENPEIVEEMREKQKEQTGEILNK